MDRRNFLKLGGTALTFILLPTISLGNYSNFSTETESRGRRFHGTSDGDIYLSQDAGKTWQLHTRLGSQYQILDLVTDPKERVFASVGFQSYHFYLALSSNGINWNTV